LGVKEEARMAQSDKFLKLRNHILLDVKHKLDSVDPFGGVR
jgi:hypothetical protein